MSAGVEPHKSEVAAAFNLTGLLAVTAEFEIAEFDFVEGLLAGPLERFGPGVVTEPVADEVSVTLCGGPGG